MNPREELLEKLETLQNMLISYSRYESAKVDPAEFKSLRDELLRDPTIKDRLPEFAPLLDFVDSGSPADETVAEILSRFDTEHVHQVWTRALERRADDPEGAITSARTLLEAVCKHILDEGGAEYDDDADLPKLYRVTAEALDLAPSQQSEDNFKRIFGGCQTVVENLGSLRNKLSDAHGRGKSLARPEPRHAELAVNLSGAIATFLVETWKAQQKR
jgi:hypothetical protein